MVANKLRPQLPCAWTVTIIDRKDIHQSQSGYLQMAFGTYSPAQITRRDPERHGDPRQRKGFMAEFDEWTGDIAPQASRPCLRNEHHDH